MSRSANITIESARLSIYEVREILINGDKDFNNTLLADIDLFSYSQKLSNNAYFTIATYNGSIIGCIAYYLNDPNNFMYISHFWVSSKYQNIGIGSKMLEYTESIVTDNYRSVLLEVKKDNRIAYHFYTTNGFRIKEDRTDKFLLEKLR